MILRRDHVAGGAFVLGGILVYALSGDLPLGSMGMPGAGMMPKLVIAMMIAFGVVIMIRAGDGPPFASIAWDDLPHALRVVAVAAAAVALYGTLGFAITIAALLFTLLFVIERKPIAHAAAFSVGVTAFVYLLFGYMLKLPLLRSPLGFF